MLVLGEEVARKEQHTKIRKSSVVPEVILSTVVSASTLTMMHRMVEHRFTTYKNVVPLWMGDIEEFVREGTTSGTKRKKGTSKVDHFPYTVNNGKLIQGEQKKPGQQLIVFPDVWTMSSYLQSIDEISMKEVSVLHSQATAKQKNKVFRGIKSGKISTLCCTYSQVFQDWRMLTSILIIDQHKRYYKSQQDPRYYLPTVLQEWAKIVGADLEKTGFAVG